MTVTALARASSLTKGFISQVEGGKSNPSLASLVRIASALEMPLSSLMSSDAPGTDLKVPDRAPAIVAARSFYHDSAGLVPLTGLQSGMHFLATVPARHALSNRAKAQRTASGSALVLSLQGSVEIVQGGTQLPIAASEVVKFDAAEPYEIENESERSAVLLIFVPYGCPNPSLIPLARHAVMANTRPAYFSVQEGPMRLAAMRAQRQKERGR
jgi:DNA-binding XRE family transcriptional regulator